jgi:hypothetical protein
MPVTKCVHMYNVGLLLTLDQLFTDFVFADFLVTYTPYVSRVIFQYAAAHFLGARLS